MGSEAAKFTAKTEAKARDIIREILGRPGVDTVVSGGCHLGGIDIWAVEEAKAMGLHTVEFLPAERSWNGGYKIRNENIANNSEETICITVRELPPGYAGMRFKLCYHCGTTDHVKSGGCWTTKYARSIGKPGYTIVID